ncbi:DUF6223 family protein [Saccharothrix sp. ALI-22-I]|uniref:DUF6223 family protein n=1 Tax=Saccharothrix sp. ALI-22-I TaxID=1933778 RepID=UPI001EE69F0F|nr:DUF6223 family protein [Saccharothrix sp. ALI-22-I]
MPIRLVLAVAGAALIGGFGLAAPVTAYASAAPTEVIRHGGAQVAFQVPGERDNADTVQFGVLPADSHDKKISEVISKFTWTAQSAKAGVSPVHAEQSAAAATGIGSGRFVPTAAGVVGLIGVVLGGLALARSTRRVDAGNGRRGAIAAGVAGLIGVVVGALHLANSAGGFGTGNGRAGAIVAVVVGLTSMVLGWLALARSRRTG